jgi:hypothetical protein
MGSELPPEEELKFTSFTHSQVGTPYKLNPVDP